MSNIKSTDTIWNTHQDYFGGYPSQSIFSDGTISIEQKMTTLPFPTNFHKFNIVSLVNGKDGLLNGYPTFNILNQPFYSVDKYPESINLPLRHLFPIPKSTLVKHNAILNGYPCAVAHNPYFINDADILKYSDQHYITPKGARQMILNILMERRNSIYALYSTQPRNAMCIAENTRIKLKWEDPVEDEWWEGTIALMRTDRFPLSDTESGTTTIGGTNRNVETGNKYKDDFLTVSNLTNGQKYYIVIATYNKERDMRLNEENKFIVVPQLTYTKVYDKYGNLIAFEPLT